MRLYWADEDSATVYFAPDDPGNPRSAPTPQEIPIGRIAQFITEQGNPDNRKGVTAIVAGAPVAALQSGMILGDTPGISSSNPAHTAVTDAEVRFADALLFVASATEPLSKHELEFLQQALQDCPIVVTAVTMIDKVVDAAPVIAEARERISSITGVAPEDLLIVGVSAHRKFDALEDGDDDWLAASGFPALEAWPVGRAGPDGRRRSDPRGSGRPVPGTGGGGRAGVERACGGQVCGAG